jgi:carbonic anhydrase/acetyltransferase-like protein (isoleucine patch superfamily)
MIDETVIIMEGARVIGSVTIEQYSSVWYNAVIRGDRSRVYIGKYTNVQDACVIHSPKEFNVRIGDYVTIGHGSIIHGAEIGDNSLIGVGCLLLNGSKVGKECIVAPGSVVTENLNMPNKSLVAGRPAQVIRELVPKEIESIKQNAIEYKNLSVKNR